MYLEEKGHDVSNHTMAVIYRELGYIAVRQPSFVWKHRESHEDE
jgi:hypothetical protein